MALPLNVFKTVTKIATTNSVGIYTAPTGYSGVVLLAQAANTDGNSHVINFAHKRTKAGIAVTTEILSSYPIQGNDTVSLLQGKLILQSSDALVLSADNSSSVKVIVSILETLN
jgi:hypothetical protein